MEFVVDCVMEFVIDCDAVMEIVVDWCCDEICCRLCDAVMEFVVNCDAVMEFVIDSDAVMEIVVDCQFQAEPLELMNATFLPKVADVIRNTYLEVSL